MKIKFRVFIFWMVFALFSWAASAHLAGGEGALPDSGLQKAIAAAEHFQGGPKREEVIAQLEKIKKELSNKDDRLLADYFIYAAMEKRNPEIEPEYIPRERIKAHWAYIEKEYQDQKNDACILGMRLGLYKVFSTKELISECDFFWSFICDKLKNATYRDGGPYDQKRLYLAAAESYCAMCRRLLMEFGGSPELDGYNRAVKDLETMGAPPMIIDRAKKIRDDFKKKKETGDRVVVQPSGTQAGNNPQGPIVPEPAQSDKEVGIAKLASTPVALGGQEVPSPPPSKDQAGTQPEAIRDKPQGSMSEETSPSVISLNYQSFVFGFLVGLFLAFIFQKVAMKR